MTSTSAADAIPKIAFLDTNALVYVFDFWETCRAGNILLDAVNDWASIKTALEKGSRSAAQLSRQDAEDVKKGLACFTNLAGNRSNYQFYTSSVCRSELHHVLLDALASERLVTRKIPMRLRVKRPQVLYRRALESGDYLAMQRDIDKYFDSLRIDYGIDIIEVEQSAPGSAVLVEDVWDTAKEVWSRVLIDVMDSYIYAAAVETQADFFITSDGSLKDALGYLCKPSGEWVSVSTSLRLALGKLESESLPMPLGPKDKFPQQ